MSWGFLNGSPNAKGHTASLAQYLLTDRPYTDWPLVNYHIAQLGQHNHQADDFFALAQTIAHCDALLIGTPVYWSDMTGLLKTFLDRCTLVAQQLDFSHIPTYVLIDGTQDPATTAPGITPAIAQLADFLKLDYQDTFVVDTSIVQRPQDYPRPPSRHFNSNCRRCPMTDALAGEDLVVGYGRKTILNHQSLHVPAGQITGLIGPNGSGKSTLLKALAGINPIRNGQITINGQAQASLSPKALAKELAYLAQAPDVPGDLTVATLVKLGRYAYHRGFFGQDPQEEAQVRAALVQAKVADLANRPLASLSGGQRQRALIAMTLAHDSPIIMLDEPTTYLDLTHQLDVLNLMQHLNQAANKTVIVVLHDLNQAARYCDQLLCLRAGQVVATGTPKAVLTAPLLADVFQVSAEVVTPTDCDYPQLLNCQTLVGA